MTFTSSMIVIIIIGTVIISGCAIFRSAFQVPIIT